MTGLGVTGLDEVEGERARPATFTAVLRHREFRSLWLAELQSVAGDQLARVAVSILVFDRTRSAGLTALTYALTFLPELISGPLLGGLADRYPRRRVMVTCDIARAGLVAMMAVPGVPLVGLAGLLVMVQMLAAPFNGAQAATLRVALDDAQLTTALATRQTTVQVGQMLGFGFGGVLVAALSANTALAVDAVTFGLSAALVQLGVRARPAPEPEPGDPPQGHLARVAACARVVWADPVLRTIAVLAWLAAFIVLPEALIVPYVDQIGADTAAAGWLLAAHPAGYVVGAVLVGRLLALRRQQQLMGLLPVCAMLPLLVFAARPPVPVALPLLALSGACGVYQIAAMATFISRVPDHWRGQAFGLVGSVLIGVQGLGFVAGGALAQVLGDIASTIAIAGGAGLMFGLWAARGWRRHRLLLQPTPPIPSSDDSPGDSPGDSPDDVPGDSPSELPGQVSPGPNGPEPGQVP